MVMVEIAVIETHLAIHQSRQIVRRKNRAASLTDWMLGTRSDLAGRHQCFLARATTARTMILTRAHLHIFSRSHRIDRPSRSAPQL